MQDAPFGGWRCEDAGRADAGRADAGRADLIDMLRPSEW